MRRFFLLAVLMVPVVSLIARAQPDFTPATILALADSAREAAGSASYEGRLGTYNFGRPYAITARISLSRLDFDDDIGYKVRLSRDEEDIAYDGEGTLYLNHARKSVTQLDSTRSFRQTIDWDMAGRLVNIPFRRKSPYSALKDIARYEGIHVVDGVECHTIVVTPPDGEIVTGGIARYWFSAKDYILRRRESYGIYRGTPEADTLTLTNLRLNAPLHDSAFIITPPPGYSFEYSKPLSKPERLAIGSVAPGWELPDTAGKKVALSDMKGQVVVIDFWYINCLHCMRAMPKLDRLQRRFSGEDVVFIGINGIDSLEKGAAFVRSKGFMHLSLFEGKKVANTYKVTSYPTYFVIGRDGKIIYTTIGNTDGLEEGLAEAIRKGVGEK